MSWGLLQEVVGGGLTVVGGLFMIVGAVGRLSEEKGFALLIEAVRAGAGVGILGVGSRQIHHCQQKQQQYPLGHQVPDSFMRIPLHRARFAPPRHARITICVQVEPAYRDCPPG